MFMLPTLISILGLLLEFIMNLLFKSLVNTMTITSEGKILKNYFKI